MAKHWDSFLSHCTMGIQQHQDQRRRQMESGLPNELRTVRTNSHVLQIDPNDTEERFCKACTAGKPTMKPFPKESLTHAKEFEERAHWDLWGPASVSSLRGKSYAAVCKDDATCTVKTYFQAKKSETFSSYKQDEAWILNHGGKPTSYSGSKNCPNVWPFCNVWIITQW